MLGQYHHCPVPVFNHSLVRLSEQTWNVHHNACQQLTFYNTKMSAPTLQLFSIVWYKHSYTFLPQRTVIIMYKCHSTLQTFISEWGHQHCDSCMQNVCALPHMYPCLMTIFTNACHMLSNTHILYLALPHFWQ
jgi:hypothetical protein